MKILKFNFLVLLSLITGLFYATQLFATTPIPLPDEDAFNLKLDFSSPTTVQARWEIAPGYFLYKDKLQVQLNSEPLSNDLLPQGEYKNQKDKRFEVYAGSLSIPIDINKIPENSEITIKYQGCSALGFCYPPTLKSFTLDKSHQNVQENSILSALSPIKMAQNSDAPSLSSLLTNQSSVQKLFSTQHLLLTYLIFAVLGLLLAFTPCVLPLIPILTGIIIGQSQPISTRKAFFLSLSYVLGSALTYALAGVIAALMGSSIQVWLQQSWILIVAAGIFFILAFSLFGFYDIRLPSRFHNHILHLSNKQQGGDCLGVFVMGMISSLIVSPCVTAPLVGVLMYIAQTGNVWFGASSLFIMGCGMGIPLILIGTSAGKWMPKSGPWMVLIKELFGIVMIGIGIKLLSRMMPVIFAKYLWDFFKFCVVLWLIFYVQKVSKNFIIRLILVSVSTVLLIFVVTNILSPQILSGIYASQEQSSFTIIKSVPDFQKQIAVAKKIQKPILLDFYADWCESCVEMDEKVFKNPQSQVQLAKFLLLRVDLSKNTEQDEKLSKFFNVIAPPTILFYTSQGHEIVSERIVGELSTDEFLQRLHTFFLASCDKIVDCTKT